MKYQVGDKVIIRKDLDLDVRYDMDDESDYQYAVEEMIELSGTTVTIESADDWGYTILEDYGQWHWADEMFVGLEKEKKPQKQQPKVVAYPTPLQAQRVVRITKVIYSNPVTVVFYQAPVFDKHGTFLGYSDVRKIVAKCSPEDTYNEQMGLNVALLKAYRKEIERDLRRI